MKRLYNKYLKWLNPYYWVAVLLTWVSNLDKQSKLITAINEADRIKKTTGKKMLVYQSENGVALISKQDLKRKKLAHLEKKAVYKT